MLQREQSASVSGLDNTAVLQSPAELPSARIPFRFGFSSAPIPRDCRRRGDNARAGRRVHLDDTADLYGDRRPNDRYEKGSAFPAAVHVF